MNLETAKEIEGIIRQNGAIVATIAILDGIPPIGLHIEEFEGLAKFGALIQKTACRYIAAVNLETAKEIEGIIRQKWSCSGNHCHTGWSPTHRFHIEELEWLAKFGAQIQKTAHRDIAAVDCGINKGGSRREVQEARRIKMLQQPSKNLETAKEIEGIIRQNGAVPATIAILDGVPYIGAQIRSL